MKRHFPKSVYVSSIIITMLIIFAVRVDAWGPYLHAEIAKDIAYAIRLDLVGYTEQYKVPEAIKFFVLGAIVADMDHVNGPFNPSKGRTSDSIEFARELVKEAAKSPSDRNLQAFAWGWYSHVYMDEVNKWGTVWDKYNTTSGDESKKLMGALSEVVLL